MADEQTTNAPEAATGPAGEQPEAPAAAPGQSEPSEPTAEQPRATEDIWQRIPELDPDELVRKHPRLAGKVGELADKLSRREREKLRAEIQAEIEARIEEERRRKLRDEDPLAFAEYDKELEEKRRRQEEERRRQEDLQKQFQATLAEYDTGVFHRIFFDAPEPVQKKLAGKAYDGGPVEARLNYLKDLIAATVEHELADRLAKEKSRWEKEVKPAIEKEVLAKVRGEEPSPDISAGGSTSNLITQDVFDRNRRDINWVRANRALIEESINKGLIKY